ncbi:hypothetical protein V8G54_029990 [Vigna mungo]|uniref:Uncharacterized protein n=1 Tax=Vigna mungo TaxID=3915 RepID=A0AAQ3MUD4_VIGMU
MPVLRVPRNHSIPSNQIPHKHFIKHLACNFNLPTFHIHSDQTVRHSQIGHKPKPNNTPMKARANFQMGSHGTARNQTQQCNSVNTNVTINVKTVLLLPPHLTKQLDSLKRVGVEGIAGDHCIVANGGIRHFIENLARVVREGAFGVGIDEGGTGIRVGF